MLITIMLLIQLHIHAVTPVIHENRTGNSLVNKSALFAGGDAGLRRVLNRVVL